MIDGIDGFGFSAASRKIFRKFCFVDQIFVDQIVVYQIWTASNRATLSALGWCIDSTPSRGEPFISNDILVTDVTGTFHSKGDYSNRRGRRASSAGGAQSFAQFAEAGASGVASRVNTSCAVGVATRPCKERKDGRSSTGRYQSSRKYCTSGQFGVKVGTIWCLHWPTGT
jgi:hypothetical protein